MKKEIPAFPLARHESILPDNHGMSLRDYFAAAAMRGWLASFVEEDIHPADNKGRLKALVTESYKVADAMLEAREK